MMADWYCSRDGKAEGPFAEGRIAEMISSGALSSTDLIYREGDDRWREAGEVPSLAPALAERARRSQAAPAASDGLASSRVSSGTSTGILPPSPPFDDDDSEQSWVLLRKKRDGSRGFDQSGPFSAEAVLAMLARGEALYTDYVWRQGFEKWVRIGARSEFDRSAVGRAVPLPSPHSVAPARPETVDDHSEPDEGVLQLEESSFAGGSNRATSSLQQPVSAAVEDDLEDVRFDDDKTDGGALDEKTFPGAAAAPSFVERLAREPMIAPPPEVPPKEAQGPDLLSEKTVVAAFVPRGRAPGPATGGVFAKAKPEAAPSAPMFDDGEKTVVRPRPAPSKPAEAKAASEALPRPAVEKTPDAPVEGLDQKRATKAEALSEITAPGDLTNGGVNWDELTPSAHDNAADAAFMESEAGASAQARKFSLARFAGLAALSRRSRMIAGAVVAGLAVGVFTAYQMWPSSKNSTVESAEEMSSKAKGTAAPAPAPPPPLPAAAIPPPPRPVPPAAAEQRSAEPSPVARPAAASYVEIIGLSGDEGSPRLDLKTDAPAGSEIEVAMSAKSGEVLEMPGFYRSDRFRRPAADGSRVGLDLSAWAMPRGRYEVHVRVGSARSSKAIFFGRRDQAFASALERHLKQISYQQQAERKALYHGSRRLERLARSLAEAAPRRQGNPRSWADFYGKWQRDYGKAKTSILSSIAPFRERLAYRAEFHALGTAATRLKAQAESYSSAIQQQRTIASTRDVQAIEAEFARLEAVASKMTARSESD